MDDEAPQAALEASLNSILAKLRTFVDEKEDNYPILDPFEVLPSRKEYPDYYTAVSEPISVEQIVAKAKKGEYKTHGAMLKDFDLMCDNALGYNLPGSQIHTYAMRVKRSSRERFRIATRKLTDEQQDKPGDKRPSVLRVSKDEPEADSSQSQKATPSQGSQNPLTSIMLGIYKKATALRDPDDSSRFLSEEFMSLPSAEDYPDYYKVITEPIDLPTIRGNIVRQRYASLTDLATAFNRIFGNAMTYNEESSQIYKDAESLLKFVTAEIQAKLAAGAGDGAPTDLKLSKNVAKADAKSSDPRPVPRSVKVWSCFLCYMPDVRLSSSFCN
jgi:protein polybromo-1